MKKLFFLLTTTVFFFACNTNELETAQEALLSSNPLLGTWKLVERSYSIGDATQHWVNVDNGYYYEFNEDGSFSSNRLPNCLGGIYSIDSSHLTLEFNCVGDDQTYVEYMTFSDGYLLLNPLSPHFCIEGCYSKFQKIPKQEIRD